MNPDGRCSSERTGLVGTPGGEHCHPTVVERFTVLEGELTVKVDGETSVLGKDETATVDAGVWHESWNSGDRDAQIRVELTPGGRMIHMLETMWGLARLGHTNDEGMPDRLQLALIAREFSDVLVFRSPPLPVQRALFAALAPIARRRGYRATYPQLSRTLLASPGMPLPA
jgi:hypothetical protein